MNHPNNTPVAKSDLQHIVAHTAKVWTELAGKTIFLTGGTGFFGKWLIESFCYANESLSLGAKLIVLSRDPVAFIEKYPHFSHYGVTFIGGDVRNFTFPEAPIDYILHTASDVSVTLNTEQPLLMFDTIVEGTRHVLELARVKNVRSVLHTSSGAVYGRQPSEITHIIEDFIGGQDVYDKSAAYGEGKRVAEMLGNIYYNSHGVPSKMARCFAFVGPYLPLDIHFAVGNFIRDVLNGNKIVIKGDGTPFRSYMYASDLAIWLWTILVFGENCRPYNVGSDDDLNIGELASLVASFSESEKEIEIRTPKSGAPPARYVPYIGRARTELGLTVTVDLRTAIDKTIQYHKEANK